MVTFQAHPCSIDHKRTPSAAAAIHGFENLCKKRKIREETTTPPPPPPPPQNNTSSYTEAVDLQLESPLPLDWQRCLDIQSGKIHFYNTRTQKRTSKDPRQTHELAGDVDEDDDESSSFMSLNLELNLTSCESVSTATATAMATTTTQNLFMNENYKQKVQKEEMKEMVAAVCMRCHLLVVLCKELPECPNCKFMHSPEQITTSTATLFNRSRCSLSILQL